MATPTGPRARAARGWFARRRRKLKQGIEDYGRAGTEPPPFRILELFVEEVGSGYAVGDRFTIDGGSPGIQPIGRVTAETGGAVDEAVVEQGNYLVDPGGALTTTAITGGGTGLEIEPSLSDLHNFGPTPAGSDSPFPLLASADTLIGFIPSVGLAVGDFSIDVQGFETFEQAEAVAANAFGVIRPLIPKGRSFVITRSPGAPACTIQVFARVKSQRIQIGEVTFT